MLKWCAYCQGFLDEVSPYDDLTVTHGICAPCYSQVAAGTADYSKARQVGDFFADLSERVLASTSAPLGIAPVLASAAELGIKPMDLFVGMIQPLLYQVGEQFQNGTMTFMREHEITLFAEKLLAAFTGDMGPAPDDASRPLDFLLTLAPGNSHTFGPKVLEFFLKSHGFTMESSTLSIAEAVGSVAYARRPPAVVGVSVALGEQIPEVEGALRQLTCDLGEPLLPRLLLGGNAVRRGPALPYNPWIYTGPLAALPALIRAAQEVESW